MGPRFEILSCAAKAVGHVASHNDHGKPLVPLDPLDFFQQDGPVFLGGQAAFWLGREFQVQQHVGKVIGGDRRPSVLQVAGPRVFVAEGIKNVLDFFDDARVVVDDQGSCTHGCRPHLGMSKAG